MKIAVTAASGKLGTKIVKELLKHFESKDIIGLARNVEKAKALELGIEILPGDYNDRQQLEQSLTNVDTILLVSGMDAPDKRIKQHQNVIEAAKKNGVKKIVYTSVQGCESNNDFAPIVKSNRQTEKDIINSGLAWVIARNGIYIEPDIEYIENYQKMGGIYNCGQNGKCGYTNRHELAFAYYNLLSNNKYNGKIYNLNGKPISQKELAGYLSRAFNIQLEYFPLSVEEYRLDRSKELGDFLGTVIAGIYQGIKDGCYDNQGDYLEVCGREHQSWDNYFENLTKKTRESN